jgi:hypothetical protein
MPWLGLDIGGANLKLANGSGFAQSHPFALWKEYSHLTQQLRTLIAQAPNHDRLAITMTGELSDCFETKSAGVQYILDAIQEASDGRHTRVYLTTGQMVTPQVAIRRPLEAAASNWHALARFVGRLTPKGLALLIDVGSTTTDLIPIIDGQPSAQGTNDTARLLSRELIYMGVERTPICAIADEAPYRGESCPLASELFATARDAYLILGDLHEDLAATQTADGRPATKSAARTRLSRMLCADEDQFNHRDAVLMAQAIADQQVKHLAIGVKRVVDHQKQLPQSVIVAGAGEFLARRVLRKLKMAPRMVALSQELSSGISRCAPAYAVAMLAHEAAAP